jgi:hypothetical protein
MSGKTFFLQEEYGRTYVVVERSSISANWNFGVCTSSLFTIAGTNN